MPIISVAVPCKSCISKMPVKRDDCGAGNFASLSSPSFPTKQTYKCRDCGWEACYTHAQLKSMMKQQTQ